MGKARDGTSKSKFQVCVQPDFFLDLGDQVPAGEQFSTLVKEEFRGRYHLSSDVGSGVRVGV